MAAAGGNGFRGDVWERGGRMERGARVPVATRGRHGDRAGGRAGGVRADARSLRRGGERFSAHAREGDRQRQDCRAGDGGRSVGGAGLARGGDPDARRKRGTKRRHGHIVRRRAAEDRQPHDSAGSPSDHRSTAWRFRIPAEHSRRRGRGSPVRQEEWIRTAAAPPADRRRAAQPRRSPL